MLIAGIGRQHRVEIVLRRWHQFDAAVDLGVIGKVGDLVGAETPSTR
jgi:hypothetical protein